ncbi:MAG: hypothetical protein RLZZ562_2445 [Planctomycetota bacterium]|jgi:hypothetical protein
MIALLPTVHWFQGDSTHVEETFRFLWLPPYWVLALVVFPAIALAAWWSYTGLTRLERNTRITLSTLRGAAIALCCVLLFQPAWETTVYRKTQNQVHVLVDDSASMSRKDAYPEGDQRAALEALLPGVDIGATSRAELVQKVLSRSGGLLEQLKQEHDVRLFRVQRKPLPIRELTEVTARGNRTQLGDALDVHLATAASSNLDAVVLVSDGRSNAGLDPIEVAERFALRGVPIHTIGVGDPQAPRNAWLVGPPGPKEALRQETVAFDVTVRAEGLAGKTTRVELHGTREGQPERALTSTTVDLPEDGAALPVRLSCAFEEAGDWTLRFSLAAMPEESQSDDNADTRFLRVNDERIRVLYLEDLPRWEYRYVHNALQRVDPSIQMQAVLFDASPKFVQEHSDELPPLKDIPRTEKELLQYHVVLIGDLAPERIAPTEEGVRSWLEMLVRFCEFGGGVGFLYGPQAMPERYRNTPLQDLLPVVLEDPVWLSNPRNKPDTSSPFRARLENPLQPHEILMLQRDPALNRKLWEEGLPGFRVYYPTLRSKPGATVLMRHPIDESRYGKRPLAVVSPHPRGNTFFIATDETWIWRYPYGELYQDAFWRNVVRHLAQGRLQRRNDLLELTVDKIVLETGDSVRVQLRAQDTELQPTAEQEQPIFLRDQKGQVERRSLRSVPGEPGTYQATFTMNDPGAFSFLVFQNQNPADTVQAREDVLVRLPDRELADSSQDAATLQKIAQASSEKDGRARSVFLADADSLAQDFKERKAYQSREETRTKPAWDRMTSLLVLLLLLGAEWILRKRARLV